MVATIAMQHCLLWCGPVTGKSIYNLLTAWHGLVPSLDGPGHECDVVRVVFTRLEKRRCFIAWCHLLLQYRVAGSRPTLDNQLDCSAKI